MIINPLARKKRLIFHHTSGWRRRKQIPLIDIGWSIRFRGKNGNFERFDARKRQRAEFYIYKKTVEDTDAPLGKTAPKATAVWVPARPAVLAHAREMAKEFMQSKALDIGPYQEYHIKEKGPIAYKWQHKEYGYLNDHQRFDGGNYCVFYILIAVAGEHHIDFLIIRKTVLFAEHWTVERLFIERDMFNDLGRDYATRTGHLWTSEAMSPQIVTVEYIGLLGYTLFTFVEAPRKKFKRKRRMELSREETKYVVERRRRQQKYKEKKRGKA